MNTSWHKRTASGCGLGIASGLNTIAASSHIAGYSRHQRGSSKSVAKQDQGPA
jgi:hypothetical protein